MRCVTNKYVQHALTSLNCLIPIMVKRSIDVVQSRKKNVEQITWRRISGRPDSPVLSGPSPSHHDIIYYYIYIYHITSLTDSTSPSCISLVSSVLCPQHMSQRKVSPQLNTLKCVHIQENRVKFDSITDIMSQRSQGLDSADSEL